MKPRTLIRRAVPVVVAMVALAAASCSKTKIVPGQVDNLKPTVRITAAPIDTSAVCDPDPVRSCYSLTINWVGHDPDGRVDHFLYAVDPPSAANAETTWHVSTRNEERLLFNSSEVIPFGRNEIPKARDYHVFVIKAVDNEQAVGPSVSRAFFSFTEAPNVNITNPLPSSINTPLLTPSVRISWTGTDNDGVFNSKPVKYKYILLNSSSVFPLEAARSDPDSLRDFYAPNFAGWDSVGGDTTTVQFTNLPPNADYMFVVVAFDEAGAYSPIFSLNGNMLLFRVGFAGALGPRIVAFNEFFNYEWSPGYCTNCPTRETFIEVPAGRRVTFNWEGIPPIGADMKSYRWVLDSNDLLNETPRADEERDTHLWSARGVNLKSVTLGPWEGTLPPDAPEEHRFYIEAEDNVGFRTLAIIRFQVVRASHEPGRILFVKDTRLKPENYRSGCVVNDPTTPWPTQAELDTFLFARGNTPWRCYPNNAITPRGIFAGFNLDTIGTRTKQRDLTVRLSTLSKYEFVVWMVDQIGANFDEDGLGLFEPMTALRYMTGPGRFNTLGAYVKDGGKVWMLGGGTGFASTIPWNDRNNDVPTITFSSLGARPELRSGRFMYDLARWQSEFRCSAEPAFVNRYLGRYRDQPATSGPSAYTQFANELPATLELKTRTSDPMPPNRTNQGRFYPVVAGLEYLQLENFIIENTSTNPNVVNEVSTLDTIYKASGGGLPPPLSNPHNVVMTYYHGPGVPQGFIFTGFDVWSWKRTQCQQFCDFVMQRMWGLSRTSTASARTASLESAVRGGSTGRAPALGGIRQRWDSIRRSWNTAPRSRPASGARN